MSQLECWKISCGILLPLSVGSCQCTDHSQAPDDDPVGQPTPVPVTEPNRPPPPSRPDDRPAGESQGPGHPALLQGHTYEAGPLRLVTPHQRRAHQLRGSGHTHCAPDHSGVDARTQQERLRKLGPDHRHHFTWMTAHSFVAPDPQVDGIHHLFGVELYTKQLEGGRSPHVVALLPDGSLAGADQQPFGTYELGLQEAATAITGAGGLSVLAHPSRYSPSSDALRALNEDLWGIEVLSGSTRPEHNARFIDERLSSGRYVCLSAGGDIHQEDYKLTSGYQVVEVDRLDATPMELFQSIRTCNFFACGVSSVRHGPIRRPSLSVRDGALHFSSETVLRSVRFVGREGRLLHEARSTTTASYQPTPSDRYVRVEAVSADAGARCYSQPTWVIPR